MPWRCLAFGLLAAMTAMPVRAQLALAGLHLNEPVCERAARAAERDFNVPAGLLLAIGRVESGRFDPAVGRVVPWPWTIDAGGLGQLFDSADAALQRTRELQAHGNRNIDIGCFQVNLPSHPLAFASLEQGFDPAENARAAARFLAVLHNRAGNWEDAVASYHSANPDRGVPYRQAVFKRWSADASPSELLSSAAIPAIRDLVVVLAAPDQRMRIWTPSPLGTAAGHLIIVAGPQTVQPMLPRVITPGG